jgi:amidase
VITVHRRASDVGTPEETHGHSSWPDRRRARFAQASWTPDATEIAERIRSKAVSAVEVVEKAVRDVEALDGALGVLVTADFDRAIDKARRLDQGQGDRDAPFAGVPFLVKDLNDYAGLPTRSGSRAMLGLPPAAARTAIATPSTGPDWW